MVCTLRDQKKCKPESQPDCCRTHSALHCMRMQQRRSQLSSCPWSAKLHFTVQKPNEHIHVTECRWLVALGSPHTQHFRIPDGDRECELSRHSRILYQMYLTFFPRSHHSATTHVLSLSMFTGIREYLASKGARLWLTIPVGLQWSSSRPSWPSSHSTRPSPAAEASALRLASASPSCKTATSVTASPSMAPVSR